MESRVPLRARGIAVTARRRRRRRLSTVLIVLGAVAAGAALGAWIGWHEARQITEERLGAYTTQLLGEANAVATEADAALDAIRRSGDAFCSDGQIAQLRDLVFQARYLKDVGRISEGHLRCSAALGLIDVALPTTAPDAITASGRRVFSSAAILMTRDSRSPVLEREDGNAVLGAQPLTQIDLPAMQYMIAFVDAGQTKVARVFGGDLPVSVGALAGNALFEQAGSIYFPACSASREVCAVARTTKGQIRDAYAQMLLAYLLLGAGAGVGIALAGLMVWRRGHSIEARLRRAIRDDELYVEYQPIVRLSDRAIVAAEALVRWNDVDGTAVPPSFFIALAEQHAFIGDITALVLRHVARDLGPLLAKRSDLRVNVNISASDLDRPSFRAALERHLDGNAIARSSVGLELTEYSTAQRDIACSALRTLRQQGHRIFLDDFGTGYSSLAYLHELDVAAIKLDRSFTRTIGTEAVTLAVLPQILDMARSLDLEVVVEGIETEMQAAYFTAAAGALRGQGWLFGHPESAQALMRRLENA